MVKDIKLIEIDCPVCGSQKTSHAFSTYDHLFKVTEDKFNVKRCSNCDTGFVCPRPESMRAYYPDDFYWLWEGLEGHLAWEQIIQKRRKQLEAKSIWLDDLVPGKLLDIGAQKGEFLWFMKEKGWDVLGVELDDVPNPAKLPIRYGNFLAMDFAGEKYDAITFWAVLEHVIEPSEFIKKAVSLLKPGGALIILVTNFNSIQSRIYKADDYPRHLTLFSKKAIKLLCKLNNLQLDRIATNQEIFGGTLCGGGVYFFKRLFGYSEFAAMNEWKQLEDPDLFWSKWKGRDSIGVKIIARIDRLLSLPLERLLDRLGCGFILTFRTIKSGE